MSNPGEQLRIRQVGHDAVGADEAAPRSCQIGFHSASLRAGPGGGPMVERGEVEACCGVSDLAGEAALCVEDAGARVHFAERVERLRANNLAQLVGDRNRRSKMIGVQVIRKLRKRTFPF